MKNSTKSPTPQSKTTRSTPPAPGTSSPHRLELLRCVSRYLAAGWAPVPLPPRSKGPIMTGWPSFRTTEARIAQDFADAGGVGLILGRASSGLVDVDLDCPEAVALADHLLPPTGMVSGRDSRPGTHRWYEVEDSAATSQFAAPDGAGGTKVMLVELRANGAQTAVPPTIHPDGDQSRWDEEGEPARVPLADLQRAVARVAAGCLLVRAWREGTRHELALALAGTLLSAGWDAAEVSSYITAIGSVAKDAEIADRVRAVESTVERLATGEPITSARRLSELLDQSALLKIMRWLDVPADGAAVDGAAEDAATRYPVADGVICAMGRSGLTPLCNFDAGIDEEVTYTDGATTEVVYVIRGRCRDGTPLPPTRVPAAEYPRMAWVGASWGARAIITAGPQAKDKLREAIQCRRIPARSVVFKQTGWVEIDGETAYLHGAGAIGAEQAEVELPPPLDRYSLPSTTEDLVGAVRCSARLMDCAPPEVSIPLLAQVYLAPLTSMLGVDFVVWLVGPSGSLKSTVAVLYICHFGQFTRVSLPANWSSTAAAIEHVMFLLADSLVVIDDYAPQGSVQLQRALESLASRIVRHVGNGSARARMTRDLKRQAEYPPRCCVLSTGEQLPPGVSIHGRMVIVEIDRAALDLSVISELQKKCDQLPVAMRGFIEWLRRQLPQLRLELPARKDELRAAFEAVGGHMRSPEALAMLMIGLELFARFAVDVGAVDSTVAATWIENGMRALRTIGAREAEHATDENPAELFLSTLRSARAGGIAKLEPVDHDQAVEQLDGGQRIGWYDATHVYLDPVLARKTVVEIYQRSGEPWPYTARAVHEALVRRGFVSLASDKRPTVQKRIWGRKERVLMISARQFDDDQP